MEKAFQVSALVDKLKEQGLDLAEDTAAIVAKATLDWVEESVVLTPNKFDDFFKVVRPMIEPELNKAIDKINGKEG